MGESESVGRRGGDEFGVLLVQADEEEAERKAAMLARAISDQPAVWKGKEMRLTVACGAHTFTGGEDPMDALAAADKAMYRAKSMGRNGVCSAGDLAS